MERKIGIFKINDRNFYAIDATYLKKFVSNSTVMVTSFNKNTLEQGILTIHDTHYTMINLDVYFNNKVLKLEDYEYSILVEYEDKKIAFLAKDIKYIANVNEEVIVKKDIIPKKINEIAKLEIEKKMDLIFLINLNPFLDKI